MIKSPCVDCKTPRRPYCFKTCSLLLAIQRKQYVEDFKRKTNSMGVDTTDTSRYGFGY